MIMKPLPPLMDFIFPKTKDDINFASHDFERVKHQFNDSCSQMVDIHLNKSTRICYFYVTSRNNPGKISISSAGTIVTTLQGSEFGTLLRVNHEKHDYTVWLPTASGIFCFDKGHRIATSDRCFISYEWEFQPHIQLRVSPPGRIGEVEIIPYVLFEDDNGQFFEELRSLSDVELRFYRKSDWFFAKMPSDVWNYLIGGSIYDPRSHKGVDKRFKCQQCAYAWWNYFGFLLKETGKKVYDVMQDEVAYSVLLDMSNKGEWGHGYWSDSIETHARFHLDGLHLLISQYEKTGEPVWLEAAERGMTFVSEHLMERLDDGNLWFLHDTIEHKQKHYFKSKLFGKTLGNSLCINTHVQALTVLQRLCLSIPGKETYTEMFEKGSQALRRVLDYQPGGIFYRILMFWITRQKTRSKSHSMWSRVKNGLESRLLQRFYWLVRRQFPRLVYPGGFIERDLTLSFFPDWYHIINLKDLLTLYQQHTFSWLRPYIENGYTFVRKFLDRLDLEIALARCPYYIELIDILHLYDKHIMPVSYQEMISVEEKIYQQTGGYSIDYYASELVRGS